MAKVRFRSPDYQQDGDAKIMVNTQVLQGQWNSLRGEVKKKWGQLTDDDLKFTSGNVDQLVGRIQHKTGEARDAIEHFLDELTSQGASVVSQAAESARNYAGYAADRMRDGYNRVADRVDQGYDVSREMIRDYPGRAVATAFGVGIVMGVVVGLALRAR
jgi:uncharacterized protein YjbJ (UPF0337 family)